MSSPADRPAIEPRTEPRTKAGRRMLHRRSYWSGNNAIREAILAIEAEAADVTHRITRDHSCAEHEPCEACVVGFWCDEHDGVRCEQWFAALQYPETVSPRAALKEIIDAWDDNALLGPRQKARFDAAIEVGRQTLRGL